MELIRNQIICDFSVTKDFLPTFKIYKESRTIIKESWSNDKIQITSEGIDRLKSRRPSKFFITFPPYPQVFKKIQNLIINR